MAPRRQLGLFRIGDCQAPHLDNQVHKRSALLAEIPLEVSAPAAENVDGLAIAGFPLNVKPNQAAINGRWHLRPTTGGDCRDLIRRGPANCDLHRHAAVGFASRCRE